MPPREIWIKNGTRIKKRPYYLYETYSTKEEAVKMASRQKRRNRSRSFIVEHEAGGILGYVVPHTMYSLYLDKIIRLW